MDVKSTVSYHFYLNSKGYRALIYSGDHDMVAPYIGTQLWIKSLNLSVVDEGRPWLGGGHTALEYRPKECYNMSNRWISREPL
ncbi:serine carboxypeptidase-like 17 [Quercus suber]|uniref:Serine carboxypeptidase-like 17 n=1 Tax=Quercus suber TaxID=58331 RepID=A0AAW0L8V4_QUESU